MVIDIPANTLRGVPQDSAYLKYFLTTISGPIVLAGHSYGGTVITNVATGNAEVKALVYVDAYLPAHGGQHLYRAVRRPGLEDDPVLGRHRYRRPGARPGRAALHG